MFAPCADRPLRPPQPYLLCGTSEFWAPQRLGAEGEVSASGKLDSDLGSFVPMADHTRQIQEQKNARKWCFHSVASKGALQKYGFCVTRIA